MRFDIKKSFWLKEIVLEYKKIGCSAYNRRMIFFKNGASGRTRTACLLLRRKSLYPDELRLHCDFYKIKSGKLQDIFIGATSQIITLITKNIGALFVFATQKRRDDFAKHYVCASFSSFVRLRLPAYFRLPLIRRQTHSCAFSPRRNTPTKKTSTKEVSFIGAPGGTRTHNLLIRSQMLYPIKLRAHRF